MKQKPVHSKLQSYLEGKVLLVNKPFGWTSFDVVKKTRILTGVTKVGHAGTLDPLATGLLIICTGKFTKKISEYIGMEKEYTGSFTLGATTPTYDLESQPENISEITEITHEQILQTAQHFIGNIFQIPPAHSAIKRDGKRVYLAARRGEDVVLEPRPVMIYSFEITKIELPKIFFKVVCSRGTYIRSLAHDFGKALGVGAHLSSLCRTRIGEFKLEDARSVLELETLIAQEKY
jgi:tRNA pseudouridine55 synthase